MHHCKIPLNVNILFLCFNHQVFFHINKFGFIRFSNDPFEVNSQMVEQSKSHFMHIYTQNDLLLESGLLNLTNFFEEVLKANYLIVEL